MSTVILREVNSELSTHIDFLFRLLSERTPDQSISHKEMPTFEEHKAFVESEPYTAWYLIDNVFSHEIVGAAYLSRQNEIGIFILQKYHGNGFASDAIKELMRKHDGPFFANVNPENWASRCLFDKLGFKMIQVTYAFP